jgi:hypothetical protein
VARPIVDVDLCRLPGWKRSLTAILYNLRCLEYWVSPQGWFREWFRLNVLVALLAGTSALLLGPVVTALLLSVAEWTELSVVILTEAMSLVSILPPLFVSVVSGLFLWKIIRQRKARAHMAHSNHSYYE